MWKSWTALAPSACYKEFQCLLVAGFKEARKSSQIALGLVEIMMCTRATTLALPAAGDTEVVTRWDGSGEI
jgi:hypothetical protein